MPTQESDRYVSQASFHDVLELLKENRATIRDQVAALSAQLATLGREIKGKQDVTNGRIIEAEEDILACKEDLQSVKIEVTRLDQDVQIIQKKGCPLKEQHVQTLTALSAAGVVPVVTDAITAAGTPPSWHKTAKKAGLAGGIMGLGAILIELLRTAQAYLDRLH